LVIVPKKEIVTPTVQSFTDEALLLLTLAKFETASAAELAQVLNTTPHLIRERLLFLEKAKFVKIGETTRRQATQYTITHQGITKIITMRGEIERVIQIRNEVSRKMAAARG